MYDSEEMDFEHYLDRELPSPFYKRVPLGVVIRVLLLSRKLPKFDFVTTKPLFLDHVRSDWRPVLETLTIPILFLAGAQSPMWPPSHAEATAALCRNATVRIIDNAGHAVNLEQPKASNEAILQFIQRI
ncbi:pimeloyl-ACP methyl ester carboxylesterase [Paenibacillus phyllosphaerae]|uniref:Pimeloyl-ACP methyl ester carboxylesterase n=1 Tax=Paenibacillus phyllosphaerae TaxID=274593 RepID=A0A7W5B252_9BACL|nr:alpha/beta hydrolase [Paenibacillus phyllosphaerae]MBB3112281.1 pimeloyl-ACP methyl ester carboxylesterase [Paenibacillus phyllosphaerae]